MRISSGNGRSILGGRIAQESICGAAWFARETLVRMGLAELPLLGMIMLGGVIFALFGVAFSARAAAIGALVPTIIGFAQSLPQERQIPVWGLTLVINYAVQFTILAPANSPMVMLAIATDTFTAGELYPPPGVAQYKFPTGKPEVLPAKAHVLGKSGGERRIRGQIDGFDMHGPSAEIVARRGMA